MTLSTLDPVPALVVVDLQRGIASRDTTPHPVAEVVDTDEATHHHSVAAIFPKIGETTTTAEVLAALAAR